MSSRALLAALLAAFLAGGAAPAVAQPTPAPTTVSTTVPTLVPSAAAPFRQKLDLSIPDAEFLFLPEPRVGSAEGPFRFRFLSPAVDTVLSSPGTVQYVTFRDGAFHLQLLHLRPGIPPTDALGPQPFEIVNGAGEVAGRGTLLVVARAPEALDATDADGGRALDVGRAVPVALQLRTNGNYAGRAELVNRSDYEWTPLLAGTAEAAEAADSLGVVTLRGQLRPRRREVPPPRFAVETLDGRTVEVTFPGLTVRAPAPRQVPVVGGTLYLDARGIGGAEVTIRDLPEGAGASPEVVTPSAELTVRAQRFDRATRRLKVALEFATRGARPAGARETHDLVIRGGPQEYRGRIEVVGLPTVALVRTDRGDGSRAVIVPDGGSTVLRVAGQNLDGLRLDCAPLGASATCRTIGATPAELTTEITPGADAVEGELLLPLVATDPRGSTAAGEPVLPAGVRVQVERRAVPLALTVDGLLALACGRGGSACRPGRDGVSVIARAADVRELALAVRDSAIPAAHGWQRLVVTVTRVRGDQRQVVRTLGSAGAPRAFRRGLAAPAMPLLDPATEVRHGDALLVKVEHALEQYGAAYRSGAAAVEPLVRTIYVDGGPLTRLAADLSVQPVLYSFSGSLRSSAIEPLYMNAGLGVTWQPMTWRMQPQLVSMKLQLIGTSLVDAKGEKSARQPALFLSGNLRVPGTDPGRPVVLTAGAARLLTGETGWRLLAGAGVDLGLSRLTFGR